jgi:hypothetical protein
LRDGTKSVSQDFITCHAIVQFADEIWRHPQFSACQIM